MLVLPAVSSTVSFSAVEPSPLVRVAFTLYGARPPLMVTVALML